MSQTTLRVTAAFLLHRAASAQTLCNATCTTTSSVKTCVYTFKHNPYLSETGYFEVDGCTGAQPTLTMEAGIKYTFQQFDSSNWMHPLGFAYQPDGALKGVPELEPGVKQPGGTSTYCTEAAENCQAPAYVIDGGASDLDTYEPQFFYPKDVWEAKQYSVDLTIADPDTKDFFYFCHIHNNMSARIKVMDAGTSSVRQEADLPALGYEYATRSAFDVECGTTGAGPYQDKALCPGATFVCGLVDDDKFGKCLEAIDCQMHVEMRVKHNADPTTLFDHQMIPHHRNAVQMAKALKKELGSSVSEAKYQEVDAMLENIIHQQNAQITFMSGWLAENSKPAEWEDRCDAEACP